MTHGAETALFAEDVVAVGGFHRDVAGAAPVAEWPRGALFDVGGSKILVHERSAALEDGPPNEDHFALAVDDLEASCDALRAGGFVLLIEPREHPWGRSAYLRDSDGRLVELAQA